MTQPKCQAHRKVPLVAPGQSWAGVRGLEQPVVDLWGKRVLTTSLPEPRLRDDNRSKLCGSHRIGPRRSDVATDSLGMPPDRQLSRKSLSDLFLFPEMDE